ncbi:MAG: DNA topoisomerase I [Candidatus Bathyarchaeia archaeon]
MERLQHNGVLVPPKYEAKGLRVWVRGVEFRLTPEQEEMAVAWAKKMGTPYVEDPVFASNFHRDFSKKLGIEVKPGDVDYSEVFREVLRDREYRASLSREERRRLAEERRKRREENKELYGYAWVDGVRMEIGNYTVEPSSIFMGRGNHPRRGSWKEGPREEDIELNLSPDAPRPKGNWKGIVWDPNAMWIARWRDKLSGKMKYVWLSESSYLKQKRELEKFEKARELGNNIERVKRHIFENLTSEDPKRRKTATVCYLIDALKIRVGDEKDEDEADTVGASTLRPEHLTFNEDGTVTFDFLGKDSIRHLITARLPDEVIGNLKEFMVEARSTLFEGIDSERVSEFLNEVHPGLSAKVFRTYYATSAVERELMKREVREEDPKYLKRYIAIMANLEAAKICNHKRATQKTWETSLKKKIEKIEKLKIEYRKAEKKLKEKMSDMEKRFKERIYKKEMALNEERKRMEEVKGLIEKRKIEGKSIKSLMERLNRKKIKIENLRKSIGKIKIERDNCMKKNLKKLDDLKIRYKNRLEELRIQVEIQRETRDYNLTTSLKSYIDPRVYYIWGKRIGYSWRDYYPATLQKKFSWVEAIKN